MRSEKLARFILIVSSVIVILVAISYGGNPSKFLPELYQTAPVDDINTIAFFRALMGLMLGCCSFWLYAALSGRFYLGALYSLMFVMFGLTISRIISLLVDGTPSTILVLYLVMEFATGLTVYFIIRQYEKETTM